MSRTIFVDVFLTRYHTRLTCQVTMPYQLLSANHSAAAAVKLSVFKYRKILHIFNPSNLKKNNQPQS